MPRRLLPLLVALVLVLVAGAGCADDVSPAARIGDVTVSEADLLEEVDEWVENPRAFDQEQREDLTPGTYPMQLVGSLLQQRIDLEVHARGFDELGLVLDDQMRQQALAVIFRGDLELAQAALAGFSDEYAAEYGDAIAKQIAVEVELQDEYPDWRREAYIDADIEVSPKYGRWDAEESAVIGPDGPIDPGQLSVEL